MGFIIRALIAAFGLYLATRWVQGISADSPGTLVIAGLLLGLANAIVRPIAIILTFPITILTLGFFVLIINAAMVALVASLLPGMHVHSFHAAFWSALIVTITGWIGSLLIGTRGIEFYSHRRG
jgi:putative membrane protein